MTGETLADVRARIDALDDQGLALLADRQRQVELAALHKTDEAAVRAPDRRTRMMRRLRERAVIEGVDPEVVQRVWTAMIDAFIDLELRRHKSEHARPEENQHVR